MSSPLEAAVERVYQAFGKVPKPTMIPTDGCCLYDEQIDPMLATPLRQLKGDALYRYINHMFICAGSKDDFLYFLPRILECQATEHHYEGLIVARAMKNADFMGWPPDQRFAVESLIDAAIDWALSQQGRIEYFDDWLRATAQLGFDLAPRLEKLRQVPTQLTEYWEKNHNGLRDAFWGDLPDASNGIVTWLESAEVQSALASITATT